MTATTSDASTDRVVLPFAAPGCGAEQPREPAGRDSAVQERARLIELCLYAVDRARSAGVVERLTLGLAEVGVVALRPDGAWFDPAQHEAVGTVDTADPALDGVIAGTEVPGFTDRAQVLRAPAVTVYRFRP
ncbi:nucleotide exchange factor GrpE [Salinifilum ghardaiensis]